MTNGWYIDNISDWLVILCRIIEERKSRQRYDKTHEAEDVFAQLLNMVYGWNLINVNRVRRNYPVVDLIDDGSGKNSIQVTSQEENLPDKVRKTLNGFVKEREDENRFCEKYDRLIILVTSFKEELKQKYQDAARNMLKNAPDVARLCLNKFDPETDIWDCRTIVMDLEDFNLYSTGQLGDILSFLKTQVLPIVENSYSKEQVPPGEKSNSSSEIAEYPENAEHLRRLADNLWINWKTGCLAADPETALSGSEAGKILAMLSPGELRLISVLVQGEGAVVSWGEIYERTDSKAAKTSKHEAKKATKEALKGLCNKVPALREIIDPEKDKDGCRISLYGWGSESLFGDSDQIEDADWEILKSGEGENHTDTKKYANAWLRRYYVQLADSFENRITNARTDGKGEEVFGSYTMIEAYAHARADKGREGETEAMLDRIERWYLKKPARSGRLMVLHGQPGDGKTTFCKKAVYARRFEGWLTAAPCVLRLSLNPSESRDIITEEDGRKRLEIRRAFCLRKPGEKTDYYCRLSDIPKNALVILDGYDELAARLDGDIFDDDERDDSIFNSFCKAVEKLATDFMWKVIITSRSMCIRRELREGLNVSGERVKFAPLSHSQQMQMLARMAELEKEKAEELFAYGAKLSELWKNKDMDRLLMIPALFRMIVVCRFSDVETSYSEAVLYSKLFHSLMVTHKGKNADEAKKLLGEYERIAARIFNYREDTCPFEERPETDELIYLFLTKGDDKEEGRLGFLHGSFRQFFLARYIVSGIQTASIADHEDRENFVKFFSSLRAARIDGDDAMVWTYIAQLAKMQGTTDDPFKMTAITIHTVQGCLGMLNDARSFGEGLASGDVFPKGPEAGKDGLPGAEKAVFNLLTALGILERACREKDKFDRVQYGEYENLCRYLQRGDYSGIDLSGLDFSGATLGTAYLKGANLAGTNLSRAAFVGANLAGADLSEADLTGAVFLAANLSGSRLEKAKALGGIGRAVNFREANLEGASLKLAEFENADFSNAVLTAADLSRATLNGARFERADLSESRLIWTQLAGAHMERACLKGANLWKAHLEEAHLKEACLDGAVLAGARLRDAHLERASLKGTYFCACPGAGDFNRDGKVFSADPGSDADLKGAFLAGADFSGAFLSQEGYRLAKNCGNTKEGPVFGLLVKVPDGRIALDAKRYEGFLKGVRGRETVNPKTEGTILYGVYHEEPIEWRVLRREYDRVLLVTNKLIDVREYHPEYHPDYHLDYKTMTWEDCELRRWLNEDFLRKAFTESERARIAEVINQNPDNERYGTKGGRPTRDRVFALSLDEVKAYFIGDADRNAVFTPYAHRLIKERGGYGAERQPDGETAGWWWLRSPGFYCNIAACVDPGVGVFDGGYNVDDVLVAVRPALWLNL